MVSPGPNAGQRGAPPPTGESACRRHCASHTSADPSLACAQGEESGLCQLQLQHMCQLLWEYPLGGATVSPRSSCLAAGPGRACLSGDPPAARPNTAHQRRTGKMMEQHWYLLTAAVYQAMRNCSPGEDSRWYRHDPHPDGRDSLLALCLQCAPSISQRHPSCLERHLLDYVYDMHTAAILGYF
jgi:hypothetical protein